MSSQFLLRMESLNEKQKEAVNTIYGPVMVIAGPGTGKTEMLSARIANLLYTKESGAMPENILCVTYTEAGVKAMRERLFQFIGTDAYKVTINTFHGFCNDVIQTHTDIFSVRELEPVSELEQYEIIEEIIDSLKASDPLFSLSGYFQGKSLLSLFSTLKQEYWTPEFLEEKIKEHEEQIPFLEEFQYKKNGKNYKAGDMKIHEIEKAKKQMAKLRNGIELFSVYNQKLKERGRYDFHDMILWVIDAFKKHPDLLLDYQERYQFILADEFQDTNGSQNEILMLLGNYDETPNIFIVGDDDQAIYRFQGANMKNILDFKQQFPAVREILLEENYRSHQKILNMALSSIEKNTERVSHNKILLARGKNTQTEILAPVSLYEYQDILSSVSFITEKIQTLIESGVNPSEISVLYRSHKQIKPYIRVFEEKKIPFLIKKSVNVLKTPFIQHIIRLFSVIVQEKITPFSSDGEMFQILHFPAYNFSPIDIAKLFAFIKTNHKESSFRQYVLENPLLLDVSVKHPDAFYAWFSLFEDFLRQEQVLPFGEYIEYILQKSGILSYVLNHENSGELLRELNTFFQWIKEEGERNHSLDLKTLLSIISRMNEHDIEISLEKREGNATGVQCLTVHSAKGLEFEYVFLIGGERSEWEKKRSRPSLFSFPPTVVSQTEGSNEEELRRLFFVALTRAKKSVEISFSREDLQGKPLEKSQFIAEIESENIPYQTPLKKEEELSALKQSFFLPKKENFTEKMREEIAYLVKDYRLSPTALNAYLKCPVAFFYTHILRVPRHFAEKMVYGNVIHKTLETAFLRIKKEGEMISFTDIESLFVREMDTKKHLFSSSRFVEQKAYGISQLRDYFSVYTHNFSKDFLLEKKIITDISGALVSGRFDRINILNPNEVCVIDYKTGSTNRAKTEIAKPSEKNPLGGDYWRQMAFYALLVENTPGQHWQFHSGVFEFLEKNEEKNDIVKFVLHITEEEKEMIRNLILEVSEKIQNQEFSFGCNDEDCEWCRL